MTPPILCIYVFIKLEVLRCEQKIRRAGVWLCLFINWQFNLFQTSVVVLSLWSEFVETSIVQGRTPHLGGYLPGREWKNQ